MQRRQGITNEDFLCREIEFEDMNCGSVKAAGLGPVGKAVGLPEGRGKDCALHPGIQGSDLALKKMKKRT